MTDDVRFSSAAHAGRDFRMKSSHRSAATQKDTMDEVRRGRVSRKPQRFAAGSGTKGKR